MARLRDKVAIITGAAQGIGAEYAREMAKEGAKIVIADIDNGEKLENEIINNGGNAINITTDVSREDSVEKTVRLTVKEYGRVDILVTLKPKPFLDITVEEWDQLMAVNVRGAFICIKSVVPFMQKQKYGKIINIASGTLFKGSPMLLHYVTSKGAVMTMTRCVSREVGDDNICINTLAPGYVMSENVIGSESFDESFADFITQPRALKRRQLPNDLVGAMMFLASSDSDFMTGQCVVVDGGSVNH